MDFLEIIDEYPYTLGTSLIVMGTVLFILQMRELNKKKSDEELSNSITKDIVIWLAIATLLLNGIRIIYIRF